MMIMSTARWLTFAFAVIAVSALAPSNAGAQDRKKPRAPKIIELEEMQNRIKESHAEMLRSQDSKVKGENVKQRLKDLLEQKKGFRWD